MAFTGTSVRSGTATMAVVKTGGRTEFAAIAATIAHAAPETDFARGIRRFGYLMTEIMLVIVILVFFANLLLHRPAVDSLLFSLALAVGLTPEFLPAIISVTLARGARAMAANGVIVRRLDAIENLGSMDLLCTDKTGTLTEGVIRLDACRDASGAEARRYGSGPCSTQRCRPAWRTRSTRLSPRGRARETTLPPMPRWMKSPMTSSASGLR